MNYITYKRFIGKGIDGDFDIPIGAECICEEHMIKYNSRSICLNTSENAHKYFMRNDDEQGMLRGELIEYIITTLALTDDKHDARWEKIFKDPICQAYKRSEHKDYWVWNHAFYNASIDTLTYIKNLIIGV